MKDDPARYVAQKMENGYYVYDNWTEQFLPGRYQRRMAAETTAAMKNSRLDDDNTSSTLPPARCPAEKADLQACEE